LQAKADKQMDEGLEKYLPNVISNYLFSIGGSQGQEGLSALANWMVKKTGLTEKNFFFEAHEDPNHPQTGGLAGSAIGQTFNDWNRIIDVWSTETEKGEPVKMPKSAENRAKMEQKIREEKAWSILALVSEVAQGFGMNDADFNRMIQRRTQMMDSHIAKRLDKEWFMSSQYKAAPKHLSLGAAGRNIELTDEQSAYYQERREAWMKDLEKRQYPESKRSAKATEWAKKELMQKYSQQLSKQPLWEDPMK
jgi:hypothetical protein